MHLVRSSCKFIQIVIEMGLYLPAENFVRRISGLSAIIPDLLLLVHLFTRPTKMLRQWVKAIPAALWA